MMTAETYWIEAGKIRRERPILSDGSSKDIDLLHRGGCVRVMTGSLGTEFRWSVFSPCFASLFGLVEWLPDLPPPFMMRYYLAGWFEETRDTSLLARRRVTEIMARGDLHLVERAFVQEIEAKAPSMAPMLRQAWEGGGIDEEYSVDCFVEEPSGRFRVVRIGPKSTIGRLWGTVPRTYPCINGGPYDRVVSAAYGDVLRGGRRRYDHVYAAMRTPDDDEVWIPYQRLIMPKTASGSRRGVTVLTEIAKVAINIL